MSASLLQRSLSSVWHPCTQMKQHETLPLIAITRGEGPWLVAEDGQRYLDAVSSWWVNLFGHCNAHINQRLREQMEKLEHVLLAGFTHEPVVRLSEELAALTSHALGHAFYASDGASATEIALKMSVHYWRNSDRPAKTRFVSLAGSYHGETVGALAVTDIALFREAYAPLVRAAATVASPDARSAEPGESARDVAIRAARALEDFLAEHHAETAALIVEPLVQCATGMAMYDAEYLRRARALCDQYEVHLIADEIAVGCGRTGKFFAMEHSGTWPDFLCLSKGISGGYLPLSLVLTTDTIYQAFYADDVARGFLHSHSYTGNALACTAALATLEIFRDDNVLIANEQRARWLARAAGPIAAHPTVRHLRQLGMILAFDVEATPGFARRFHAHALAEGLLLRPIGNTVYWMPPYVLDEAQCAGLGARTLSALEKALAE
ncbi:adenosylmethionine--8-amino-7-oxononanoate transaminase [Uliginosibacterium sp. 31-12]|uniref:adenosylmethionine--8-amino-7-oxononanoate transaminase n=1 Tax=Uliginosibacterium sp. 31-12 TaxID=3062781 RepID=UPI0026E1E8AF|nr:adenosylmethionine--8-amino-7-oxononanoate transaminase [Uliginosibacterium sp. 31-12]MDO6384848.1 adenosylmethionine--8-amino-7-oxononanoate transaminase [Uliginosibacterium sp. 31-12]